ncbi:MAG: TonB family protein [Sulfurimonadaceae bacterium]
MKAEPKKIEPAPVVEEKMAEEEPVEIEQEESATVAVEDQEVKELIVTPTAPVALSPTAQKAIDAPPSENITPEDAYVKAHIAEIMALLRKNLYYPRMARKRGIEGKVLVRFELMENGDIKNITVIESARDVLARSAITTIERLDGKFPLPTERLVLNVPIMYQLN